jgi:hypothetical protein
MLYNLRPAYSRDKSFSVIMNVAYLQTYEQDFQAVFAQSLKTCAPSQLGALSGIMPRSALGT